MSVNANNATLGKPALTGAVSVAPVGTALPTDASSELPKEWVSLGYISDSGFTNSNAPKSTAIKAWGGDEILRYTEDMEDTFQFKLVEALNVDVLKTVYGEDAVTGSLTEGLKIAVGNRECKAYSWCVDTVLNGAIKRIVIPSGIITSMSDISYADNDALGYDITITAVNDSDGNKHYEYILKEA